MLIGHAVMGLFMRHGRDNASLGIGPADHADTLLARAILIPPVGGDGQRRFDLLAGASWATTWPPRVSSLVTRGGREQSEGRRHRGIQRGADMAVLGDMAQRGRAQFLESKCSEKGEAVHPPCRRSPISPGSAGPGPPDAATPPAQSASAPRHRPAPKPGRPTPHPAPVPAPARPPRPR